MSEAREQADDKWRPRFSLLTMLLLTAIAGMAIVIALLWREVGPLRTEVRMLRDETGRLSIEDGTKIHAIAIRTDEDHTWKWRVWVPQGTSANVRYQFGNVPKTGVPAGQGSSFLESGEHWITLKAHRDRDGNWVASLSTKGGGVGTSIGPNDHWFDWRSMTATGEGVGTSSQMFDDDKPVIFLNRMRAAQVNNSRQIDKMDGPTAGFIVWLERQ
jgi:hypothetical protein